MEKFTIVYVSSISVGSHRGSTTGFFTFDVFTCDMTKPEIGDQIKSMLDHVDKFLGEPLTVVKGKRINFSEYGL
jgi:hypothetical protein